MVLTPWALVQALSLSAWAGSGPWVVGDRSFTVYVGGEAQQFHRLALRTTDGRDVIDVGEGIATFGLKGIATVGLGSRAEVELSVPWSRVEAHRADAAICDLLGLGACERTQGVGVVQTRAKGLVLDEFFGAPISLSVGAELRFGQLTAETRQRVTNLGEGTLDVGAFADVGRTGALGRGFWSAWLEGIGRYRAPMTDDFAGGTSVPGSELGAAAEVVLGPRQAFGFGPRIEGLWRPSGLDFDELDLGDPDRFGALSIATARVGGVAVVRTRGLAAAMSVSRTAVAVNNPTDTLLVSVGVQVDGRIGEPGDG